MSALDFFRKLAFAADPMGAEVNREWKTLLAPRLVCRLKVASNDARRDEEVWLEVTEFGVKIGSATKRTGFKWREVEMRSARLAKSVLRRCAAAGMMCNETYPSGDGKLADTVLVVRSETIRHVFRFHKERTVELKPFQLLWALENPESQLRISLETDFLSPVNGRPRKVKVTCLSDSNICASCDRVQPPNSMDPWLRTEDGEALCPRCAPLRNLILVDKQGDGKGGFREVVVRQAQGQPNRKLLESKEFSFIVFLGEEGGVTGFHLTRQGGDRVLMWKRGEAAEAFESRNVGATVRFDVFVDSTFETAPVLENLEACGGNIRTEVMGALREGLLSYRRRERAG